MGTTRNRPEAFCAALIIAIAGCYASACGPVDKDDSILLDVSSVVLQSPAHVTKVAGVPDSVYTINIAGKRIFCQLYRKHNIEIQFEDGKASGIVVYGPHSLPFDQNALAAFKLDHRKHPTGYLKNRFIRWTDAGKFSAITFYNPEKDSTGKPVNFNIFFSAASH